MPLSSPAGYRKRDNFTGRQFGGGGLTVLLAVTTTDHESDTREDVSLRKADWSEHSPDKLREAWNDLPYTIPEGTRVYIAKIMEEWRILHSLIDILELKIGKPDADIAAGSSGTVSIWNGATGADSDTGENIDAVQAPIFMDLKEGKFITVWRMRGAGEPWYGSCWEPS